LLHHLASFLASKRAATAEPGKHPFKLRARHNARERRLDCKVKQSQSKVSAWPQSNDLMNCICNLHVKAQFTC